MDSPYYFFGQKLEKLCGIIVDKINMNLVQM